MAVRTLSPSSPAVLHDQRTDVDLARRTCPLDRVPLATAAARRDDGLDCEHLGHPEPRGGEATRHRVLEPAERYPGDVREQNA